MGDTGNAAVLSMLPGKATEVVKTVQKKGQEDQIKADLSAADKKLADQKAQADNQAATIALARRQRQMAATNANYGQGTLLGGSSAPGKTLLGM
jgi:hypothetical protein